MKKFFSSEKSLILNFGIAWLVTLGIIFEYLIDRTFKADAVWIIEYLSFSCVLIVALFAYFNHDKNVMKSAVSAMVVMAFSYAVLVISKSGFGWNAVAKLVLAAAVFITHLSISADHSSSEAKVHANQIFTAVYLVVCAVELIISAVRFGWAGDSRYIILSNILLICGMNIVVIIESKVDAYKLIRDKHRAEGTWTAAAKAEAKKEVFGEEQK